MILKAVLAFMFIWFVGVGLVNLSKDQPGNAVYCAFMALGAAALVGWLFS